MEKPLPLTILVCGGEQSLAIMLYMWEPCFGGSSPVALMLCALKQHMICKQMIGSIVGFMVYIDLVMASICEVEGSS